MSTMVGRRISMFPVVIAVIAALFGLALVMTRSSETTGTEPSVAEIGDVVVTGATLPLHESTGTDRAIGLPAPTISGEDFDGADVAIANDGRAKLILFLAHWCPHCQNEVPVIQGWIDRTGGPGDVDLYSVSTGVDRGQPNYPASEWLAREGWTIPVIRDDAAGSAAEAYGLDGFPFFAFVRADGTIAGRASGELSIDVIEKALAEL